MLSLVNAVMNFGFHKCREFLDWMRNKKQGKSFTTGMVPLLKIDFNIILPRRHGVPSGNFLKGI
jgi:hypothetical protein